MKLWRIGLVAVLTTPLFYSPDLFDTGSFHRFYLVLFTLLLAVLMVWKSRPMLLDLPYLGSTVALMVWMVLVSDVPLIGPDLFILMAGTSVALLVSHLVRQHGPGTVMRTIGYGSIAVASIVALVGILQSFGFDVAAVPEVRVPGSTLADRPFAAEYMVGVIPWVLVGMSFTNSLKKKSLWGIILILNAYYFFLLRSRASLVVMGIGLAAGLAWLWLAYGDIARRKLLIITGATVTIVLIGMVMGMVAFKELSRTSFTETVMSIYDPGNERLGLWAASWDMFLSQPLTGVGGNMWAGLYPAYHAVWYNDANIYVSFVNPHFDVLEMFTEYGIPGGIMFLFVAAYPLYFVLKQARQDRRYLLIALSMGMILMMGLFGFPKDRAVPVLYMAIGAGFGLALSCNRQWVMDRRVLILFIALAMGLVLYQSTRIKAQYDYLHGMQAKFKGDYSTMQNELGKIVPTIFPVDFNQMPVSYYKGAGYFEMGKYLEAIDQFQDALHLRPEMVTIKHNLATATYSAGGDAEHLFFAIKDSFPNYIEPRINLIALYANQGDHQRATDEIRLIEGMRAEYEYILGHQQDQWSHYESFKEKIIPHPVYNQMKVHYASSMPGLLLTVPFKLENQPAIYLWESGQKRQFPDEITFRSFGYTWEDVITLPNTVKFPDGEPLKEKS